MDLINTLYELQIANQHINHYIIENRYDEEIGIITEGEKLDKFKSLVKNYLNKFKEAIKNLGDFISSSFKKIKEKYDKKIKNAKCINISNIDDLNSSKIKKFVNSHNKQISIKDKSKDAMEETIKKLHKYKYGLTNDQISEVEKAIRNNELIFLNMGLSKDKILVGKIFDLSAPTLVVKNYNAFFSKEICKYMDIFLKETNPEKRKEILEIKISQYVEKYDLPVSSEIRQTIRYREIDTSKLAFIFTVETSFKENLKQLEKTYNSACKIFDDNIENFKEEINKLLSMINFYNTNYSECIKTILDIVNNFFDKAVPVYK